MNRLKMVDVLSDGVGSNLNAGEDLPRFGYSTTPDLPQIYQSTFIMI